MKEYINISLKIQCLIVFFLTFTIVHSQTTIRYQGLDGIGDDWNYTSNPGNGQIGTGDSRSHTPSRSLFLEGSDEENADPNVIFDNVVNLDAYSDVRLSVAYSSENTSNNNDLWMDVSYDNGTTWTNIKLVDGSSSNENLGFPSAPASVPPFSDSSYVFDPSGDPSQIRVRFRYDESGGSDNEDKRYYIDSVHLYGTPRQPEIEVRGNNVVISDGDTNPSTTDNTDFGSLGVGASITKTYTIFNTAAGNLNLTGTPIVTISGSTDFAVTSQPITTVVANGLSTSFEVTYTPSATGSDTADISIANNDSNENPYNFRIEGNAVPPEPEIDIQGLGISIASGDVTPSNLDDTDFGNLVMGGTNTNEFTILNTGPGILDLNGTPLVSITGAGSANFTVTMLPSASINAYSETRFRISYTPSAIGTDTAIVSIDNDDITGSEDPYTFTIQGTGVAFDPTPYCEDFSTSGHGWNLTVNGGGTNSWVYGTDSDLSGGTGNYIYTYQSSNQYSNNRDIRAQSPAINLSGYQNLVVNMDIYHRTESNYDYARVYYSIDGGSTWVLLGYADKSNGGGYVDSYAGGSNWYNTGRFGNAVYGWTGNSGGWMSVQYDLPSQGFDNTADVRFQVQLLTDGSSRDVGVGIDNFCITGEPIDTTPSLACGPGGVNRELRLWLKAGDLALTDGANVATWDDAAFGTQWTRASSPIVSEQPTFHDNATNNVNGNPVVSFDAHDAMYGRKGYYNESLYIVFHPATTMKAIGGNDYLDLFCGDDFSYDPSSQDVEGIAINQSSARFENELISYLQRDREYYGKAVVSTTYEYDIPVLFNVREKTDGTGVDLFIDGVNLEILGSVQEFVVGSTNAPTTPPATAIYKEILNSRFWLGRSEIYSPAMQNCFDGDIVEVLSFSDTNTDEEKQRIESYLAIKYGLSLGFEAIPELGVPHIAHNFYDSNGAVLWDAVTDNTYTHNVAGIGRDDCSGLNQQQSKSVEPGAVMHIGLGNIYDTNNLNIADGNDFTDDMDFLMWGSTSGDMTARAQPIEVVLGPATTTTITDVTKRTWKAVERATADVGQVKISLPKSSLSDLPPLVGNDAYVIMIADDDNFTSNVETIFLNEEGDNLVSNYDFDGTKYFVIGVAHEVVAPRHLEFDGVDNHTLVGDKIDITGGFTMTAWVRTTGNNALNTNKTIVAKNNGTEGYEFTILTNNLVQFFLNNGVTTDAITSNTPVTIGIWHNVAVSFDGTTASLYIDGVLDATKSFITPTGNSASFAIGAVYEDKNNVHDFFQGDLDEIKIFKTALTTDQIRYMMNQEIEESGTSINGSVIPNTITKNDIASMNWSDILAYYSMNTYIGTHLNDVSGNGNRGSLVVPDKFELEVQSSPLPYISSAVGGDWDTAATWTNGTQQTIPGSKSIIAPTFDRDGDSDIDEDDRQTIDWNIVQISSNVTMNNNTLPGANNDNRGVLGLMLDDTYELEVQGGNDLTDGAGTGNGITISHYLNLDGKIDLEGESQLIQTNGSVLTVGTNGDLERDQQGTADTYTYNYWSSPVGTINIIANNDTYESSYTVPSVLSDGTNASSPGAITFLTSGYDGSSSPFGIADYWIWKFANLENGNYSLWQHTRSTGIVLPGEGYTMKGPGTGPITANQNYAYNGKPNNGDISLGISADNNYLVGNPYPSAISATAFINDNPDTSGTLYFWEHWGGGSHYLADYQGGYGLRNLSGGTPAPSHPDLVNQTGNGTKTPGEFIPVSQGFYVYSPGGGTIHFENDQRVFEKEDASGNNSVFMRSSSNTTTSTQYEDNRMKFRIGFDSFNGIHRQLLLTKDENASNDIDWGYDGSHRGNQIDDMYWMIDNEPFIIQGTNVVNTESMFPLGIEVKDNGNNSISIDQLKNVPDNLDIYVYDSELSIYHDIRQSDYQVYLTTGEYNDRFFIVFSPDTLGTTDNELNILMKVYYNNDSETISIYNPAMIEFKSLEVFNILGQSVFYADEVETQDYSEIKVPKLSEGVYIVTLTTETGNISEKFVRKKG